MLATLVLGVAALGCGEKEEPDLSTLETTTEAAPTTTTPPPQAPATTTPTTAAPAP